MSKSYTTPELQRMIAPWRVLIDDTAAALKVCPTLIAAIVVEESDGNPWKTRFEPLYSLFTEVDRHAKERIISPDTERVMQGMSWGLMQILGATARAPLGFAGDIPALLDPETNLSYGCRYIAWLYGKYAPRGTARDKWCEPVVAAYNAGSPRRAVSGKWSNEGYVRRVESFYRGLGGHA